MEWIVIAFRSRAHTVKFSELLTKNGIKNQIVNTPKEAGVGCGLSVKISKNYFNVVKKAVFNTKLSSFAGFFSVKQFAGQMIVKSI